MDVRQATARFAYLPVRLRIVPRQQLILPALSKGNTLRGAFGTAFRRLVCIPQCRDVRQCPLGQTCPYRTIFEPAPPPGSERLSRNQDIPRPFIFRPPLSTATTYAPGQAFDFTLTLLGKALDFLPYFILAFREVAREGIGLNRAPCTLERVEQIDLAGFGVRDSGFVGAVPNPESGAPNPEPRVARPDTGHPAPGTFLVYSAADELFRTPQVLTMGDYIQARLAHLSLSTVNCRLSTVFLTPTDLKAEGHRARRPEFHHLFKRVRDRLNALSTFYGPGPIDADFRGLGQAAEKVRTVQCDVLWQERSRRSSKTGQRHELSGFVGKCLYEFPIDDSRFSHLESGLSNLKSGISNPDSMPLAESGLSNLESGISNPDSVRLAPSGISNLESEISNLELLHWLICGELIHAGRHTPWGNGWYQVSEGRSSTIAA